MHRGFVLFATLAVAPPAWAQAPPPAQAAPPVPTPPAATWAS